jgi:hypothetical protein
MDQGFQLNRHDDLVYLTIPSFTATGLVAHAFTTRLGGMSAAPYESLNLGFHVGDTPGDVAANRERVCRLLGAGLSQLVAGRQVHGNRVITVDASRAGRGALSGEDALPGVDALVTAEPGVLLSSYYADCVPLFFLDPVRRVVALAHAGWKGTVLRIGAETVRHMEEHHGCRAGDILAAVGPAIGSCCYEVDQPVIEAARSCLPGRVPARPGRPGRWLLDLPEMNRLILLEAGIRPGHITMAGYCTACRGDLFYSHRAQNGRTGRMASLIMLTGG